MGRFTRIPQIVHKTNKKAIRIMCKIGKRGTCRKALKELNILTLPSAFILEVILFVYDNPALFPKNEEVHEKNTRRKADLRGKKKYTGNKQAKHNVSLGAQYYNRLLKRSRDSRDGFKDDIKKFLITHCFYSSDEFLQFKECKCEECFKV
jgi:hypothetical protein